MGATIVFGSNPFVFGRELNTPRSSMSWRHVCRRFSSLPIPGINSAAPGTHSAHQTEAQPFPGCTTQDEPSHASQMPPAPTRALHEEPISPLSQHAFGVRPESRCHLRWNGRSRPYRTPPTKPPSTASSSLSTELGVSPTRSVKRASVWPRSS